MCYFESGFRIKGLILKIFEISSIGLPGNVAVKLKGTRLSAKKLKGYETTRTNAHI